MEVTVIRAFDFESNLGSYFQHSMVYLGHYF